MAKAKKKTPIKSKTSVKKAKPAVKSKSAAKSAKSPRAAAKSAKPVAKAAAKVAAKMTAKLVAKAKEKVKEVAKAVAKPPKLSKEELKKQQKAAKEAAREASKVEAKQATKPGKKAKGDEDEPPLDDFEELEVAESYGDAIRLTPEDLEDPEDIFLTDAEGRRYCKVKDCDQLSAVEGFCRYHYLALWKKIQTRKKILADGKLEKYIDELTSRYPDKYIEMIRRDLKTEKDFLSAIQELEIDDSADGDFEEDSSFVEEIRGMGAGRTGRGSGEESSGGGEEF